MCTTIIDRKILNLQGEVFYGDHEEAPYTPAPFPESTQQSQMAYIWVSEYLMNTAGWALQKQHVLHYSFGPTDVSLLHFVSLGNVAEPVN